MIEFLNSVCHQNKTLIKSNQKQIYFRKERKKKLSSEISFNFITTVLILVEIKKIFSRVHTLLTCILAKQLLKAHTFVRYNLIYFDKK